MSTTTLTKTMKTKTFWQKDTKIKTLAEKSLTEQGVSVNIIFVPEEVTPLAEYKKTLLEAGYSAQHVKEIIEGLAESPLYESKTSK